MARVEGVKPAFKRNSDAEDRFRRAVIADAARVAARAARLPEIVVAHRPVESEAFPARAVMFSVKEKTTQAATGKDISTLDRPMIPSHYRPSAHTVL